MVVLLRYDVAGNVHLSLLFGTNDLLYTRVVGMNEIERLEIVVQ